MAFYSAQNSVTFDGTDDARSYGVKVLQTVYKTIVEAATKEKTAQSRASNYWYLDANRHSGSYDAVSGSGDGAIYDYTQSSSYAGLGMFLMNGAGETMFLFFCTYGLSVGTSQDSSKITMNPMSGSYSKSDNGHVMGFNESEFKEFCGLGMSISANNFGGASEPWDGSFFSDGDLKPVTDDCYGEDSYYWENGEKLDVIVGLDEKNILIDRRMTYANNRDRLLVYGSFLSNKDVADTETDCIFAIQQHDSNYYQLACAFRDKAGRTTWNPNGSNLNNMRYTRCGVNCLMIDGTNNNAIPYTGVSFGWVNLDSTATNIILNSDGNGYKGITDTNKIRVVPANAMITNKAVYATSWVCIAKYTSPDYLTGEQFSLLVAWDADNDPIA
jgi:hypothetical protein